MKLSNLSVEEIANLKAETKVNFLLGGYVDSGETFDVAIVLGGPVNCMEERASAGAELYKSGRVKKLITSGGVKREVSCGVLLTEAEHLKNLLVAYGVNANDVVLENEARTTKENMICSTLTLSRSCKDAKKVVIVTSPNHLKRSVIYGEFFLPKCYKVYGYAVCNKNKTLKIPPITNELIAVIDKEIRLIKEVILAGFSPDLEI